jgi:uncharacterized protein (DUF1015 family)
VPGFQPFAAVRYNPDRVSLSDVVAPPYDVIDPDEQARLEARSPYNVVHVDLARESVGGGDRYETARCLFEEWRAAGVLVTDNVPGFYLYRMGWRDEDGRPRQTSGVLGALELDPDGTGAVLPHERTMPRPLGDRLRLMRACRANISPIWVLSLAAGLGPLAEPTGPPLGRCTDDEGVHHRLWRLTAPATVEAIAATVAAAPVVIADGHHRYETALAYQREWRERHGNGSSPADFVLTYVVELAAEELDIRPIHRLLSGLPPDFDVVAALSASFDLEPAPAPAAAAGPTSDAFLDRLAASDALGVVTPDAAYLLRPRTAGAPAGSPRATDSELLEAALVGLPDHEIGYHHDPATVLALVDKGDAQVGLLLRPATVQQIAAAVRDGRRLPQKTTFFHPKLRTGLVFRLLD